MTFSAVLPAFIRKQGGIFKNTNKQIIKTMKTIDEKIALEVLSKCASEDAINDYLALHKGTFLYLADRSSPSGVSADEIVWKHNQHKETLAMIARGERTNESLSDLSCKGIIDEMLMFCTDLSAYQAGLIWETIVDGTPYQFSKTLKLSGQPPIPGARYYRYFEGRCVVFEVSEKERSANTSFGSFRTVTPFMQKIAKTLPLEVSLRGRAGYVEYWRMAR